MNFKKYLKISIIIVLAAGLIAGIYYFFQKNPAIQNAVVSLFPGSQKLNGEETNGVIEAEKQSFQNAVNEPIFDYWINSKNESIYYLNPAGQVIKLTNGSEELANSQTLPKLNKISASSDGTYALAKFNYPTLPTFSVFNTVTNAWQALPANTIAAAWSPNSQELIYADNKSLNILNLTNQKTVKVINLTQKELDLSWILPQTVMFSMPPTIEMSSTIWSLNLSSKVLLPLIQGQSGLSVTWSQDGELGIKFQNINKLPQTSLIDKNGSDLTTLSFITLPSKCLIENNKIYCAVPKNINEGVKLPDDYYKKAIYFDDTIYLIDLSNAGVTELKTGSDLIIDAEHLEISSGKLFFKNRLDDKLYSLAL